MFFRDQLPFLATASITLGLLACQSTHHKTLTDTITKVSVEQRKPLAYTPVSLSESEDRSHAIDPLCIAPYAEDNEGVVEPQAIMDNNIWARIRHNFQFQAIMTISRQQVNLHRAWFRRHPEYIERVLKRGKDYLHFITEEVERRGMPGELVLLPIVESAFDPFAYSSWRASGMWQIIPSTGRYLGLKQTWWYDGRRDVYASTHAALDYLEQMHKRFDGDWLLALAAYNSGAGTVNKAIRRNKRDGRSTNFWYLELPEETRHYVPKLLALSHLFNDPKSYDIALPDIPNEAAFSIVNIDSQIDLAQASELADIEMDQLYQLNPGFNRWATDPGGPHRLLIPADKATLFEKRLAELPKKERVTWRRHKIRSGETLSHISARYKISLDSLITVNNIRGVSIRAGKTLMVPSASKHASFYSQSQDERRKKAQSMSKKGKKKIRYTVRPGDSFWLIAKKYAVRSASIARWNNMSKRDTLRVGQSLVLWLDAGNTGNAKIRKISYKVRTGDSLSKIASKFRIQINDIKKWNQLDLQKYLRPGQALVLFVDVKS